MWHQVDLAAQLPEHWLLELDLQIRRTNQLLADTDGSSGRMAGPAPNTWLIARPIVGYQVLRWLSVWVGYAFNGILYSEPALRSAENVAENRIFQQLLLSYSWGPWSLKLRTRFEQRHRSRGPGSAEQSGGETTWAFRLRQQVQATFEIRADRPWLVVGWDEVFVNCNTTGYITEPGFNQNRAFLGLGYAPDESVLVELGYLNQYSRSYGGSENTLGHVLYSSLKLQFDLSERR